MALFAFSRLLRHYVAFSVFSPTVTATSEYRPLVPGVAFALNPDYGTAAIYFANHSVVEVARVEGSPGYKSFWRKSGDEDLSPVLHFSPETCALRRMICSASFFLSTGFCDEPTDFSSTEALLRTLKASVVSYLGTTFCFADVVIPDTDHMYQKNVIQTAIKNIGLRQSTRTLETTHAAINANNLHTPTYPIRPEQVVLSIDYSASELTTALYHFDSGLILPLRKAYLPELGAVHRPRPDHDVAVRRALAEVSQTPFGRDPFGATLPDVIGHVVLLGDAVLDPGFLDILQSVVGTTLVENAHALNPVFAGAVGMAKYSHEWMDNMDFDVEPAFGCRWQSRLYSVDPKDL